MCLSSGAVGMRRCKFWLSGEGQRAVKKTACLFCVCLVLSLEHLPFSCMADEMAQFLMSLADCCVEAGVKQTLRFLRTALSKGVTDDLSLGLRHAHVLTEGFLIRNMCVNSLLTMVKSQRAHTWLGLSLPQQIFGSCEFKDRPARQSLNSQRLPGER